MGIALLGPLLIDGNLATLGRRDRVVLSALAVRPGQAVSAEQLADALWGNDLPASWAKVIQGCVVRLRKVLGTDAIETDPHGYRLTIPRDEIDVQRFERGLDRGRELISTSEDPERVSRILAEALSLWRGRALAVLDGWEQGRAERDRLDELRHEAEELHAEATIRSKHDDWAISMCKALVDEQPLREHRWALLALAQYRAGRQADALATIRTIRALLVREIGSDPGAELVELEQAVLRMDPELLSDAALPEASPACPYRGLLPYDTEDADLFFGRGADIAACLRRLGASRVLCVAGPSGAGKSSLVRAGVVASLRREGRAVAVLNPGPHPVEALARHRPRAGTTLVVDQCEEVWSLCHDGPERAAFLDALVRHAASGSLVVALRADHLVDVSTHRAFAGLVETNLHLITAMDEDGLRAAILEPARSAGLQVEPALVQRLVQEVADSPGALPMMSHALRETWLRREGRTLTLEGYEASGGIREAVARSAEHVYTGVDPEQQATLRALLLRLVMPGPQGEPVRTRVPRRQVSTGADNDHMVDLLVDSRLVTSDDEVVEIAHEALARAWPRLRDWLAADLDGQRILHHLATAADSWDGLGRPDSELYRGVRLAEVSEWRTRTGQPLSEAEEAFVDTAERLARAELRAAEDRADQQRRVNRRLRGLLAVAAALVVAVTLAGLAAVRQTDKAEEATTVADAQRVAARGLTSEDTTTALLLSLAGTTLDDSAATRASLVTAVQDHPALVDMFAEVPDDLTRLDVSPDGDRLVTYDMKNVVRLYDTSSGEILASLDPDDATRPPDPHGGPVTYAPDGKTVAVGLQAPDGRPVRLLDSADLTEGGSRLGGFPAKPSRVADIAYSRDGRYLAASLIPCSGEVLWGCDRTIALVWDLEHPSKPVTRVGIAPAASTIQVALSPHGRRLYTSYQLTTWSVLSGKKLSSRPDLISWIAMDLDPRGELIALAESEWDIERPDVLIVDAATGSVVHRLQGDVRYSTQVRFSHDGSLVAASSSNQTVRLWDVESGETLETMDVDESTTPGLGFSPDDTTLYTTGTARRPMKWDLAGDRRMLPRRTIADRSSGGGWWIDPSPDARLIAFLGVVEGGGASAELVEVSSGETLVKTQSSKTGWGGQVGGFWGGFAWRPDGERFATLAEDGVLEVWDPGTRESVRAQVDAGADFIASMDWSPDGDLLVVAQSDGDVTTVRSFDAVTLDPVSPDVEVPGSADLMVAGPDRTAVLTTADPGLRPFDSDATRWARVDLDAGRILRRGDLAMSASGFALDLSPSGRLLAVGGNHGEVALIDVITGDPVRPPVRSHGDPVAWVAFDEDGRRLLSIAADSGSVSIWDGESGDLTGTFILADGVEATARFVPDSDEVLFASASGDVLRWNTSPSHTRDFACDVVGRNLTREEWSETLPGYAYRRVCPDLPIPQSADAT